MFLGFRNQSHNLYGQRRAWGGFLVPVRERPVQSASPIKTSPKTVKEKVSKDIEHE